MAFVPVPNTVLVELRMRLDSQRIENTLYFNRVGGWAIADLPPLFNALLTWWTAQFAPNITDSVELVEMHFTDLSTATSFSIDIPAPTPHPVGAINSAVLPNSVALAVSFRTALRGRSFHGRNFVPGLADAEVTRNTVLAGRVTAIQTAYNNLIGIASGLGDIWVVASRNAGGVPRVTGVATPITSAIVVDPTVDSQRRRLPGRGQ